MLLPHAQERGGDVVSTLHHTPLRPHAHTLADSVIVPSPKRRERHNDERRTTKTKVYDHNTPQADPHGPGLLLEQTGLYSSNAKKKFEGGEGASHQKRVERVHTDRTTHFTPVRIIATVGTYHSLLGLVILSGWGGRRCTQQGFKPATHTHTGTPTPPR